MTGLLGALCSKASQAVFALVGKRLVISHRFMIAIVQSGLMLTHFLGISLGTPDNSGALPNGSRCTTCCNSVTVNSVMSTWNVGSPVVRSYTVEEGAVLEWCGREEVIVDCLLFAFCRNPAGVVFNFLSQYSI